MGTPRMGVDGDFPALIFCVPDAHVRALGGIGPVGNNIRHVGRIPGIAIQQAVGKTAGLLRQKDRRVRDKAGVREFGQVFDPLGFAVRPDDKSTDRRIPFLAPCSHLFEAFRGVPASLAQAFPGLDGVGFEPVVDVIAIDLVANKIGHLFAPGGGRLGRFAFNTAQPILDRRPCRHVAYRCQRPFVEQDVGKLPKAGHFRERFLYRNRICADDRCKLRRARIEGVAVGPRQCFQDAARLVEAHAEVVVFRRRHAHIHTRQDSGITAQAVHAAQPLDHGIERRQVANQMIGVEIHPHFAGCDKEARGFDCFALRMGDE